MIIYTVHKQTSYPENSHWSDATLLRKISLDLHVLDKYISIENFPVIIAKYQVFSMIFCQFG